MRGKRGQMFMVYVLVAFLFVLVLFTFIDPLKENLDANRGASTLNCIGTPDFNRTAFDAQNTFEKLTYRPTCFVTGIGMVWLVGAGLVYAAFWLIENVRKK